MNILCVRFMVSIRYLRMNGGDTQPVGKMKRSPVEEWEVGAILRPWEMKKVETLIQAPRHHQN